MPVYGGTLATGLILWKGVRLNMGETGPMFGGENGGHGLFTDAEQQALIDYHDKHPRAAEPEPRPGDGQLHDAGRRSARTCSSATNDTGLNPTRPPAPAAPSATPTPDAVAGPTARLHRATSSTRC